MNEVIRTVMRHERILTRWSAQLCKDFAKQRKTNRKFAVAILGLTAAFIYEDYNLYKTDQQVKELRAKLNKQESKDEE